MNPSDVIITRIRPEVEPCTGQSCWRHFVSKKLKKFNPAPRNSLWARRGTRSCEQCAQLVSSASVPCDYRSNFKSMKNQKCHRIHLGWSWFSCNWSWWWLVIEATNQCHMLSCTSCLCASDLCKVYLVGSNLITNLLTAIRYSIHENNQVVKILNRVLDREHHSAEPVLSRAMSSHQAAINFIH